MVFESLLDPRGIEHVVVFTQEKRALERKMSEMEEEMKVRPLPGPAGPEQPSAPKKSMWGPQGRLKQARAAWVQPLRFPSPGAPQGAGGSSSPGRGGGAREPTAARCSAYPHIPPWRQDAV